VGAAALTVASINWSASVGAYAQAGAAAFQSHEFGSADASRRSVSDTHGGRTGEFRSFHPSAISRGAWLSLLYLIVAGSIIGYTAYVWLIHHESPTKVGLMRT